MKIQVEFMVQLVGTTCWTSTNTCKPQLAGLGFHGLPRRQASFGPGFMSWHGGKLPYPCTFAFGFLLSAMPFYFLQQFAAFCFGPSFNVLRRRQAPLPLHFHLHLSTIRDAFLLSGTLCCFLQRLSYIPQRLFDFPWWLSTSREIRENSSTAASIQKIAIQASKFLATLLPKLHNCHSLPERHNCYNAYISPNKSNKNK